jgi:ribonuclease HI
MTDHFRLRAELRAIRDRLRLEVRTAPDHAIAHHRADELFRDVLEDVLHESAPEEVPEGLRGVTMGLRAEYGAEGPAVTVYTDGSQRANGDGGWAWWANPSTFASGAERFTTNQVMELWAAIEAIGAFNPDVPLRIVSDSAYVVNCFHERWFDAWRDNGWRNGKREPVANRATWEELLAMVDAHRAPIEWVHIRGHGKANSRGERPDPRHVHGNDQADRLATAASAALS